MMCRSLLGRVVGRSEQVGGSACVEVLDEGPDEAHLLASVFEYHLRVARQTTEAVGSHHHREVVGIHLGDGRVLQTRKLLIDHQRSKISHQTTMLAPVLPSEFGNFTQICRLDVQQDSQHCLLT